MASSWDFGYYHIFIDESSKFQKKKKKKSYNFQTAQNYVQCTYKMSIFSHKIQSLGKILKMFTLS